MAAEPSDIIDFTLPSLGSDMDEGTVLQWLVEVGDAVHKGDVLVQVDTEKSDIDVEVWHDAVVEEILVGPGETVPVGTALARLGVEAASAVGAAAATGDAGGTGPTGPVETTPSATSALDADEEPAAAEPAAITPSPTPTPAPSAGVEHVPGDEPVVDPRLVYWPGPAGAARAGDATAAVAAVAEPAEAAWPAEPAPTRAERRQARVAALMEQANREIPHFHLVREIDLTEPLAWLERRNEDLPPTERVLSAALLLSAIARAAAGSPINGTYEGGPVDADHVDLGVAVNLRGGGLVTPVLPAAESLTLDELMAGLRDSVGRARAGRMNTQDLTEPTLTVTNLGDAGADRVFGVIRPPQRALVGIGRVVDRPVAVDGRVVVRSMADVTLTADHRVVNGHAGARFLERLIANVSNPSDLTSGATP